MDEKHELLMRAKTGDITAFHELFAEFQGQLKSYLYRLTADRNETEDLAHDTFVKAFDKIASFRGTSSVKTWVFTIATNLARDVLRSRKRWPVHAQDDARAMTKASPQMMARYAEINKLSPRGAYEIREHIDFCFTCLSKTLTLEHQVALILKDMYEFKVKEITVIVNMSHGVVKHLIHDARKTMIRIFDSRCALISKNGVCHQCSELNGLINQKHHVQQELLQVKMLKAGQQEDRDELLRLRTHLIGEIDPLHAKGADLHEHMMQKIRRVVGEIA
ncbi:MAG: sigma-70 family RNA polymerase sigma factor [bacterium]|nr:sigma-70 family RNA polymerase sigma factor [bacterium]